MWSREIMNNIYTSLLGLFLIIHNILYQRGWFTFHDSQRPGLLFWALDEGSIPEGGKTAPWIYN